MGESIKAGPSVLVVEDNESIRAALLLLLEQAGFLAAGAANGEEALRRLRGGPRPNLILLDLQMPVMDGWQFRRRQTQDPALAPIPVLVLSADEDLEQKAANLRAAGFLQKPVDFSTLLGLLRNYCRLTNGT